MFSRLLIAALVWTAVFSASSPSHAAEPVDLELVLAVDVSGSIDAEEAKLQRQGYVSAFLHPDVLRAIQTGYEGRIAVTYFEWAGAGWQRPVVDWTPIGTAADARAFAELLAAAPIGTGPFTSISGAIQHALPLFGRRFQGTRRVIDISGDGENNSGPFVVPVRDLAVAQGVTINGLPIINNRPSRFGGPAQIPNLDQYFVNCVIGGRGAFIIVANDFSSFAEAIRRKLILEIADLSPPRGSQAAGRAQTPTRWHRAQAPDPLDDVSDCNVGYRRMQEYYRQRPGQF